MCLSPRILRVCESDPDLLLCGIVLPVFGIHALKNRDRNTSRKVAMRKRSLVLRTACSISRYLRLHPPRLRKSGLVLVPLQYAVVMVSDGRRAPPQELLTRLVSGCATVRDCNRMKLYDDTMHFIEAFSPQDKCALERTSAACPPPLPATDTNDILLPGLSPLPLLFSAPHRNVKLTRPMSRKVARVAAQRQAPSPPFQTLMTWGRQIGHDEGLYIRAMS